MSARSVSGSPRPQSVKVDYRTTPQDFDLEVKNIIKNLKDLIAVEKQVYALPKSGKVTYQSANGPVEIGRLKLGVYQRAIHKRIANLSKRFNASVGQRVRRVGQSGPRPLTYISDQMVNFFATANLGNVFAPAFVNEADAADIVRWNTADAGIYAQLGQRYSQQQILQGLQAFENALAQKEGRAPVVFGAEVFQGNSVQAHLSLLLQDHMTNMGLMMTLFALYNAVNGLQSSSNGQRYHYDAHMLQHFGTGTNTQYLFFNQPMGWSSVPTDENERKKYNEYMSHSGQSAFDRIRTSGPVNVKRKGGNVQLPPFVQQGQETPGTDDWGILLAMNLKMISFFIIPTSLFPPERQEVLKPNKTGAQNPYITRLIQTQAFLHNLLMAHQQAMAPGKKSLQASRRAASSARSRSQSRAQ